jgi:hypothetical protein
MVPEKSRFGDLAMLPEHHVLLEEEPCPVADQTLGELYRASAHGLNELIATVSPTSRALLAVYCYRRAHLASVGLAIAATCEKDDLTSVGGNIGAALFDRSRDAPQSSLTDARVNGRRKITLATKPLRQPNPITNEEDFTSSIFNDAKIRLLPKVDVQRPRPR